MHYGAARRCRSCARDPLRLSRPFRAYIAARTTAPVVQVIECAAPLPRKDAGGMNRADATGCMTASTVGGFAKGTARSGTGGKP
mgnify:CR=1 FL=1